MTIHVLPCLSIYLDPIVWCIYLCVHTEMHPTASLFTVTLTANSANKKCINSCTCAFAKGESLQHRSLNVSVYFHGNYYDYT